MAEEAESVSETPETPADDAPEVIVSADALDGVGDFDATEETPAAEAETPAEGEAEGEAAPEAAAPETPATPATPAAPEAKPETPAAPAEDPAAAEAQRKADEDFAAWNKDYAEVTEKLAKGDIDPIDDAPVLNKTLKTLAKGFDYVKQAITSVHQQQAAIAQERAAEATWQQWGEQNPDVSLTAARKAFAEEVAKVQKDFPEAPTATLQKLATKAFEGRVATLKKPKTAPPPAAPAKPAGKAPPAPTPKAPLVKKGGAQIAPTGATRAPAPVKKTPEDLLAADIGGGVKDVWS